MNDSNIAELETEISLFREMTDRDKSTLENSIAPSVDDIFLSSSKKRLHDLENHLFRAKSERAHELISMRLIGNQMTDSIRLKSLVKLIEPFNTLLEQSAWKFWDKDGKADRLDEHFSNLIDLRLAGIQAGSTELVIPGNTAPDLTADSALEEGLKNLFSLLSSPNDEFADHVHVIGLSACKALSKLMEVMEKQNIAAEFKWPSPEKDYFWEARPAEITRVKAILDDIGEPSIETEKFRVVVQVLSIRNKIEIYRSDTESKLNLSYHRSLAEDINELHPGDQREFVVEKTVYPFRIAKKKKDAYTLKAINYIDFNS